METLSIVNLLSVFLTVTYVIVVSVFLVGWLKLKIFKPQKRIQLNTKVSIIIAARNEELNIGKTIADILAQTYEKALYEVIVIDDHSTDATAQIVKNYASQGVKLISLNLPQGVNSYKKMAIQAAIGQASGDLIVTTDADCRMGKDWLATIVFYYQEKDFKLISSPVTYFQEKSLFERMQTLEFSYLIGLGASTIGIGKPSTCNGANLCYEKEAFLNVGGFKGIDDLASGDDELLLHKIAAAYKGKVGFLKNADAIVYTEAKPTLSEFIQQRKRWASKSTRYKEKGIIVLGVAVWLFNLSIIANAVIAFFNPIGLFFLLQIAVKAIIEAFFLQSVMRFFKRSTLLLLLPILSLVHVIYIVYIGVAGNSGKYNWKGRMVN